jgi:hypothetical protein
VDPAAAGAAVDAAAALSATPADSANRALAMAAGAIWVGEFGFGWSGVQQRRRI